MGSAAGTRVLLGRAERQASILEGAAAAFARTGFSATSMEDAAAAAGITKLIVYRHFGSKEELYRAILQQVSDRLEEEFVAALEHPDRRGVGARSLLTVARERPEGFVLLWRHAVREPQFAAYAAEHRHRAVAAARLLLGEGSDEVLQAWAAEAIVSWLVEAVLSWLDTGDPDRDDELLERVTSGLRAMRAAWVGVQGRTS